ncbi:unnamed protein product [Closterium sp. Yama58-4]|nr:unnamed protein product [Closterium sp. Yama58-4]
MPAFKVENASNIVAVNVNWRVGVAPGSAACVGFQGADKTSVCPAIAIHRSYGVQVGAGTVYGRVDVVRSMNVRVDSLKITAPSLPSVASPAHIRVALSGIGPSLLKSNVLITNNEVYNARVGIVLHRGAVGVAVASNYVHGFTGAGIMCGAGPRFVGDCMLVNVSNNVVQAPWGAMAGAGKAMGIVFSTHWINPGNVASCNYVVNGALCYDLDAQSSGVLVHGGACIYAKQGVRINNGKMNVVKHVIMSEVPGTTGSIACPTVSTVNCLKKPGSYWEAMRLKYYNSAAINTAYPYLQQICTQTQVNGGMYCNPDTSLNATTTGNCSGLPTENNLDLVTISNNTESMGYDNCLAVDNVDILSNLTQIPIPYPKKAGFRNLRRNDFGLKTGSLLYKFRPRFKSCPRRYSGPRRPYSNLLLPPTIGSRRFSPSPTYAFPVTSPSPPSSLPTVPLFSPHSPRLRPPCPPSPLLHRTFCPPPPRHLRTVPPHSPLRSSPPSSSADVAKYRGLFWRFLDQWPSLTRPRQDAADLDSSVAHDAAVPSLSSASLFAAGNETWESQAESQKQAESQAESQAEGAALNRPAVDAGVSASRKRLAHVAREDIQMGRRRMGVHTPIVIHRGTIGAIVRNNYVHDFLFAGIRCGSDVHFAADCMLTQIDRNHVVAAGRNRSGDQDAAGIYYCVHWFSPAECNYIFNGDHCYYLDFVTSGVTIKGGACVGTYDGIKVNNGKWNSIESVIIKKVPGSPGWSTCFTPTVLNCDKNPGTYWELMRKQYYDTPVFQQKYPFWPNVCTQTNINGKPCNTKVKGTLSAEKTGACSGLPTENYLNLVLVETDGRPLDYKYCENLPTVAAGPLNDERGVNLTDIPGAKFLDYANDDLGVNPGSSLFTSINGFKSCPRKDVGPRRIDDGFYYLNFNRPEPDLYKLVVSMATTHIHNPDIVKLSKIPKKKGK